MDGDCLRDRTKDMSNVANSRPGDDVIGYDKDIIMDIPTKENIERIEDSEDEIAEMCMTIFGDGTVAESTYL